MIRIQDRVIKEQKNFWSAALFHPTDAVEDPWGRRILDRIAADKAIQTVRVYSMFEDIVYLDENGRICYDFRLSDLRLDYLTSCGFKLLVAYAGMPDCIAETTANKTSVSKNKTRYKGKMWNTSVPRDYAVWEELCYEYTKHNIERYGEDVVAKWQLQCFNESDVAAFFMGDTPEDLWEVRCEEYCKLYEAYEKGIRRASEKMTIGGPALAHRQDFLGAFLDYVKENHLRLDFISLHNYGATPAELNDGSRRITVANNVKRHRKYAQNIAAHGFEGTEIVIDEWGFATGGFLNREECPALMFRETEKFASYYVKLISEFIQTDFHLSTLMICLSGQHEMVEDFSGFRNFFTLNFIAKPIYNAHLLASRLKEGLLAAEVSDQSLFTVPTKNENGEYAVLLTYASEYFEADIPDKVEALTFDEDITGKEVTVWRIDKSTANPYGTWMRMGCPEIEGDVLKLLLDEGQIKPVSVEIATSNSVMLPLSPNATYLVEVRNATN